VYGHQQVHVYLARIYLLYVKITPSQWPRGLRHELSSLARTLGSSVRIPLEPWIFVLVYSVFVLSCVYVAALRWADPPSKESYRLCKKDYESEEEIRA
jgi:hypothetical protein